MRGEWTVPLTEAALANFKEGGSWTSDQILNAYFEWVVFRSASDDKTKLGIRRQSGIEPNHYIVATRWTDFPQLELLGAFETLEEAKSAAAHHARDVLP